MVGSIALATTEGLSTAVSADGGSAALRRLFRHRRHEGRRARCNRCRGMVIGFDWCWRGFERITIELRDGRHALDGGVKERRGFVGRCLVGPCRDWRARRLLPRRKRCRCGLFEARCRRGLKFRERHRGRSRHRAPARGVLWAGTEFPEPPAEGAAGPEGVVVVSPPGASLADAGGVAGPSPGRSIVDRRHPVDSDEHKIPAATKKARKVWRSRGIERPLLETGCIAQTLR